MSFEVRVKKRRWIRAMQIMCILISIVMSAAFAALIVEAVSVI